MSKTPKNQPQPRKPPPPKKPKNSTNGNGTPKKPWWKR